MASVSITAKGRKSVGKRGHPAAANIDNSRTDDEDSLDDFAQPSKRRRSSSSASRDRKSDLTPPETSPVKPTKSGGRSASRGRNAKVQATTSAQVSNQKIKSKEGTIEDWSNEDLAKLIENLGSNLPKSDTVKYSTQVDRIDWSKVQFEGHTAEECKEKWAVIMTKLRRFRTLSELATDAKEWMKHPWMSYNNSKPKPPGLPKKPLTPYFRYYLEKRAKYAEEHPELLMTDLTKVLAKKFGGLPEKKKAKYKESYEKDIETYKILMEKFKVEHPDVYKEMESKSRGKQNGPLKPQTSLQLFLADKISKYLNEAGTNKKDVEEKYRNQWKNLANGKKVRWIKKAMLDEERYEAEFAEYCLIHPDYKPEQKKSVITKAEKEIKDKFDGKPDKPPNSGYSFYSKVMLKELKDIPSKEKMSEIARRWKELSEKERQVYAKQATEATKRYQVDYKQYVANLTEDERKKLDVEDVKKKTKKREPATKPSLSAAQKTVEAAIAAATNDDGETKPKKPISALFLYQQEKLAQYKSKNPDRSEQELTRQIAREYGELTEKKKDKYKKMAEEVKKTYALVTSTKESDLSDKIKKTEPKKPPRSAYALFTKEMLSKLTDIEAKFRMIEIAKLWAQMSNTEKEKYKRQFADVDKKYQKDIQKFLSTLTDDEQKVYQQMKGKKSVRRNTKAQAAAAAAVKLETESPNSSDDEESSEEVAEAAEVMVKLERESPNSSDDEESSKEENKESSDSENESGSDSDSAPGSDNPGSESDSDNESEVSGSEKDDSDEESD